MAKLAGSIIDSGTGDRVAARVHVLESGGSFAHPPDALQKVGPGVPFFNSNGTFEVDVARGPARLVVERGTEYVPTELMLDIPSSGTQTIELEIERWSKLGDQGWYPGNTHIRYDVEERPNERLHLDPRVEDLRMTAISIGGILGHLKIGVGIRGC